MPGRLEFDLAFGQPGGGRRRDDSEPLRMLVLGDFSGLPAAQRQPLASRALLRVDADTLDAVMQRIAPRMTSSSGEITFHRVSDFHPDRLLGLDLFTALRAARLNPPVTADDVGRLLGTVPASEAPPAAKPSTGIDALIREIVAPHVVQSASAGSLAHRAVVDGELAGQMRTLLHHAAFQSLESAWRGVHWLVSNLELDGPLSLQLLDVTREELHADIVSVDGQLARTGVHAALVDRWRRQGEGGGRLLVGLFDFGSSDADVGLLAAMGLIASRAGGPFLAGAADTLVSSDDAALAGWRALRRSTAAPWIGLAAPRVLLRQPYGSRSDPIESFTFEEIAGVPAPSEFLWAHASLATALLIGQAFNARGWEMEPGDVREIGGLPVYTFVRDGEREMQPCAERFLTEREIDAMLQAGLMPIASRRDRDSVVMVRVQSIADPPAPLNL